MKEMEQWVDIKGYGELYQVSSLGKVRSLDHIAIEKRTHRQQQRRGRILRLNSADGYCLVRLCRNGVARSYKVHRLVALAFIPRIKSKPIINHRSGDKLDNRIENLQWSDNSHNMIHAYKLGLKKPAGGYHFHKNNRAIASS